ncbi:hypothetical protein TWF569_005601 [Orbilia oligospora]|nr:hypothetical protein TWF569_005601 [Orbilia oligospora]
MEASESVHTVTVANTNDHIALQIGIDGFSCTASKCKPQKITGNSGHRSSLESCFGNRTKRPHLGNSNECFVNVCGRNCTGFTSSPIG